MQRSETTLLHSVAFRVTEQQWIYLQRYAEKEGWTVPQIAKAALFEKAGLKNHADIRRRYGQIRQVSPKNS